MKRTNVGGFSVLELVVVMAIIGVLTALLLPAVGAVRTRARQSETRALFSQLSVAGMNYRADYGQYPLFGQERGSTDTVIRFKAAGGNIYRTLAGYDPLTGKTLHGSPHQHLNRKGWTYFSFSEAHLDGEHVVDSFGNRDIVMVLDTDSNRQLDGHTIRSAAPAQHHGGHPDDAYGPLPEQNIRQPIVLYSAGGGAGREVISWNRRK